MTDNALKGKVVNGTPPLGYRVTPDKYLEIDPVEGPLIIKIFEMYAEGNTYAEIMMHLNELGHKTKRGADFNKNSITRIINNEKYLGKHIWRGIEVKTPQIVSQELFDKCQDKLARIKPAPGRGKAKVDYLLSGKLFCGICGASMNGESGTGRSGATYNYYKCHNAKKKNTCTKKPVKKDWIEQQVVLAMYHEVLSKEDVTDRIVDAVMSVQRQESDNGSDDTACHRRHK